MRAIARPIPLDPPVTSAARPCIRVPPRGTGGVFGRRWGSLLRCRHGRFSYASLPMAPGPPLRALRAVLGAVTLSLALVVTGCGGGDGDSSSPGGGNAIAQKTKFPSAAGKTLAELRRGVGAGPVLAPTVSILTPGDNRYGFALFDRARKQLSADEA